MQQAQCYPNSERGRTHRWSAVAAALLLIVGTWFPAATGSAQAQPSAGRSTGTWRLVRTPNPRGGPDAVSIMQTAEPMRSDLDLAGLMLRCAERDIEVVVVLLKPFPPRAHPTGHASVTHLQRPTCGVHAQRVDV